MYVQPQTDITVQDCHFYHVMDLPGCGLVGGEWDLRGKVDEYLGQVGFGGRAVLEIGPASGFLTAEMEQRGASVVALELPPEAGWDYVPYPPEQLAPVIAGRAGVMHRLRNSFWFTHAALRLRARLVYANAYDIPAELGQFDIAVLACVLLHCHSPLRIVEQCARRANTVIITDIYDPALDGLRACQLVPTVGNRDWGTWWHFSPDLFVEFLRVMGFRHFRQSIHTQQAAAGPHSLFTIVASRDGPAIPSAMVPTGASTAPPGNAATATDMVALRASVAQLQQQIDELKALAAQVPLSPVGQDTDAMEAKAEREMQQCALRSLPLLPNEIRLDDSGLHLAGYAGAEGCKPAQMVFFVNGCPIDEIHYPIYDPVVTQRFSKADGQGLLVRARMTRGLDMLRAQRIWRFDISDTGAYRPERWRQAVHFMNPVFERFPLPPAGSMQRAVGSADAVLFAMGGAMIFKNLENWLAEHGLNWSGFPRVLDWGCGVGRLTRYLLGETAAAVTGVDIDPEAIEWCRANLPGGAFEQVPLTPPTDFAAAAFDLVISVSVLTHLTEREQDLWLAEMQRITRPSALLFVSVRGATQLAYADTPGALYLRIQTEGFIDLSRDHALDAVIADPDYYRSAMHSRDYIARRWGQWFEVVGFEDGIAALQDFVVLRRR